MQSDAIALDHDAIISNPGAGVAIAGTSADVDITHCQIDSVAPCNSIPRDDDVLNGYTACGCDEGRDVFRMGEAGVARRRSGRPVLLARGPVVLLLNLARLVPTKLGTALPLDGPVRRLAKQCGDCVAIHKGVYLFGLEHAELGRNVSVHPMCYLDATGGLVIGNDVSIAHGASMLTTEHDYTQPGVMIRDAPSPIRDVRSDAR